MNLIRTILFSVLFLQFLGFLYVKLIYEKEDRSIKLPPPATRTTNSLSTEQLKSIVSKVVENTLAQHKALPTSTEYTDNQKKPIKEVIKITKLIKKAKPLPKMHKKVLHPLSLSSKVEKYAKRMLGKKYVWGAVGPSCYDCSGFTQRVYRKVAGIKLPRVSYLQAKVGKRIAFNKLKQGDMVFFDTKKKRTGSVNHVGIYLKNGNFIHASSGGKKVMITNFNKKRFYKNRFLWGRRIIQNRNIAMKRTKKINTI
jgi:cell wall-associated NlpC family hydrolase